MFRKRFFITLSVAFLFALSGCAGDGSNKNSFASLDQDGDGTVSFDEFDGTQQEFDSLDKNNDGNISAEEFEASAASDAASGDVNGDAMLNVLDVVSLAQYVLGVGNVSFECAADFNGDSMLNVLDIVQLVNYILS